MMRGAGGVRYFHQDNATVHNSILVTDYLTKMGIQTVRHPPYSPGLGPCDFCLFPKLKEKLRGCRYSTIEMKKAVTKVIDTLTQDDFHGALEKLLELYIIIALMKLGQQLSRCSKKMKIEN